jgi:hypothetical protein
MLNHLELSTPSIEILESLSLLSIIDRSSLDSFEILA